MIRNNLHYSKILFYPAHIKTWNEIKSGCNMERSKSRGLIEVRDERGSGRATLPIIKYFEICQRRGGRGVERKATKVPAGGGDFESQVKRNRRAGLRQRWPVLPDEMHIQDRWKAIEGPSHRQHRNEDFDSR